MRRFPAAGPARNGGLGYTSHIRDVGALQTANLLQSFDEVHDRFRLCCAHDFPRTTLLYRRRTGSYRVARPSPTRRTRPAYRSCPMMRWTFRSSNPKYSMSARVVIDSRPAMMSHTALLSAVKCPIAAWPAISTAECDSAPIERQRQVRSVPTDIAAVGAPHPQPLGAGT